MAQSHNRTNSISPHAITRHYEYFLPGGDLFIMIDNVQFRIHSYFFDRESPWFRTKLAVPASPGMPKPGTSESTAMILSDVRPTEFARFLWVFYNPKFSIYNAPVEDWSIILRLAHRWTFHEVKELAIRELQKLDCPDIDRIVLYHDCQVDKNLLIPRYAAICEREEPITLEEGIRLGLETTLMLARAREYARGRVLSSGERSPISANIARNEMGRLIRQLFDIPPPPVDGSEVTNTITMMAPTMPTGNVTTSATSSSQQHANGNANDRKNVQSGQPAPDPTTSNKNAASSAANVPPNPPSKNDTTTTPDNATNGSAPQDSKLERTGSNRSTNNAVDASKDGGNDSGKDVKNKNKNASNNASKDFKDKTQNDATSDVNPTRTVLDNINTFSLFDFLKDEKPSPSSPSVRKRPSGGKGNK